jgi:RNA polymerase sigma-70 factor (ECF subfamily)
MAAEERLDTDARFDMLAAKVRAALVRRARRILADGTEAEDVVQETLSAVWERRAWVAPEKLRAYLFRAVEFNALKRRARRRRHVPLEDVGEVAAADLDASPVDVIDPVEMEHALAGLPATQQAVLRLKYYAGMTFREIGQALSISANTASSRCRYALAALRRRFGHREPRSEEEGRNTHDREG